MPFPKIMPKKPYKSLGDKNEFSKLPHFFFVDQVFKSLRAATFANLEAESFEQ